MVRHIGYICLPALLLSLWQIQSKSLENPLFARQQHASQAYCDRFSQILALVE
jgi:hypothetical protein